MYDELVKALRCDEDVVDFFACKYGENTSRCDTARMMLEAADAIEELSRENESLAKSVNEASEILRKRWITVTEALPKPNEYNSRGYAVPYLVMNGWMMVTARRTEDYWVLFGEGTVLEYVTHWMPLPEPPKEK